MRSHEKPTQMMTTAENRRWAGKVAGATTKRVYSIPGLISVALYQTLSNVNLAGGYYATETGRNRSEKTARSS